MYDNIIADFQPMMNQQPVAAMGATNFTVNTNTKAVLFLLSQVDIPDQVRRPHLYQFNGQFRMDVNEAIDRQVKRHTPAADLEAMMLDSTAARSSIIPSADAQIINAQSFRERWTFVLVVDNDNGIMNQINMVKTIPSRMLYSGYVDGEPFTVGMNGQNVFNPAAIYSTTHHLTLSANTVLGANGAVQSIDTAGDYNYVDGILAQNLTTNGLQLYNTSPYAVVKSITTDPQTAQAFNLTAAPISAYRKAVEVPTELNSPSYHLRHIVQGLTNAKRTMNGGTDFGTIDIFAGNDLFLGNLTAMMTQSANSIVDQLDPSMPFSFETLQQKYGNRLDVVIMRQPKGMQIDLSSPAGPTPRSVFSSILATSVPPLLAQFGLCEIAFVYDSWVRPDGGLGSTNGKRGVMQVFTAASLYPVVNESEIKAMVDRMSLYLDYTVWPIILQNTGHFRVNMHCSLAGASLVDLNFHDNVSEPGYIHSSNLLGGINSPLLGTSSDLHANASSMVEIINDVRATGSAGETLPGLGGPTLPIF